MNPNRERGFSLIEVLISMAVLGIIIGVIANALIIGFKTTDKTNVRLNESQDNQLLASHLLSDVQSVAPDGARKDLGTLGCGDTPDPADPPAGTNLLQLTWTDAATGFPPPGGASSTVAYRLAPGPDTYQGAVLDQLTRYVCTPSGTVVTSKVVAQSLKQSVPPVVTFAPDVSPPSPQRITLTLTEGTGYTYKVGAERRTPNTTTSGVTTTTSVVGSTTTTTLPCTVSSGSVNPAWVGRSPSGHLDDDVALSITVTPSNCGVLHVDFNTGTDFGEVPLTPDGSPREGVIRKKAFKWTTGTKTLSVKDANEDEKFSFTLEVTP